MIIKDFDINLIDERLKLYRVQDKYLQLLADKLTDRGRVAMLSNASRGNDEAMLYDTTECLIYYNPYMLKSSLWLVGRSMHYIAVQNGIQFSTIRLYIYQVRLSDLPLQSNCQMLNLKDRSQQYNYRNSKAVAFDLRLVSKIIAAVNVFTIIPRLLFTRKMCFILLICLCPIHYLGFQSGHQSRIHTFGINDT